MKTKLFLNTTTSLIAQLITLIVGLVLPRFILEQYGSEVNGLTQSIRQFLSLISFLDMGVGQVVRSALYKPLVTNDNLAISKVVVSGRKFYRKIAGFLSIYVVLLMLVYPYFIDYNFDWYYISMLILVLSIGSFAQYYFGLVDNLLLLADQRGYISFLLQITLTISKLFICICLINRQVSIHILQFAIALIFLIKPIVTSIYVKKRYKINNKIVTESDPITQKWNGFAQHISSVVLESTDNVILTIFSTLINVSIYSIYHMIIAGIMQFYTSLTAGIQSAVGVLWAKSETKILKDEFEFIEIILHMVTVFTFGCTLKLIIPFVQIYTNGLEDANYIQPLFAYIITIGYAIRCLRTPYNIWILAAGHYRQTQQCHIFAAIINIIISIIVLQRWGLIGIAIGTLVAFSYQTIWMAVYVSNNLIPRPLKSLIKQIVVDIVIIIGILTLTKSFHLVEISYYAWTILALKTAVVSLFMICICGTLFYKSQTYKLAKLLLKRFN